ncbi:hypothetical protein LEMLEM_LOCUS17897 [Lemmus lemmus]
MSEARPPGGPRAWSRGRGSGGGSSERERRRQLDQLQRRLQPQPRLRPLQLGTPAAGAASDVRLGEAACEGARPPRRRSPARPAERALQSRKGLCAAAAAGEGGGEGAGRAARSLARSLARTPRVAGASRVPPPFSSATLGEPRPAGEPGTAKARFGASGKAHAVASADVPGEGAEVRSRGADASPDRRSRALRAPLATSQRHLATTLALAGQSQRRLGEVRDPSEPRPVCHLWGNWPALLPALPCSRIAAVLRGFWSPPAAAPACTLSQLGPQQSARPGRQWSAPQPESVQTAQFSQGIQWFQHDCSWLTLKGPNHPRKAFGLFQSLKKKSVEIHISTPTLRIFV